MARRRGRAKGRRRPSMRRDTRNRLLEAAEALFADHGFKGVSLRTINERAGARNTSAAHYHFGSKGELIRAVFARRMDALNGARMQLLDAAEAALPPGRDLLVAAIRAIVQPTAALLTDASGAGRNYVHLMVRAANDPAIGPPLLRTPSYQDVARRFFAIATRALPDVPPPVVVFRMRLGLALGIHALGDIDRFLRQPDGSIDAGTLDLFVDHLIDYLVGGLTACPSRTQGWFPGVLRGRSENVGVRGLCHVRRFIPPIRLTMTAAARLGQS